MYIKSKCWAAALEGIREAWRKLVQSLHSDEALVFQWAKPCLNHNVLALDVVIHLSPSSQV